MKANPITFEPTFTMKRSGSRENQAGFSILEVIFGVIMLTIMLVGMSQLLVTGFQQQDHDTRDILAKITLNNVAERLRSRFRDNYGANSTGGGTYGGCPGGASPYDLSATAANMAIPLPPSSAAPPALVTKCPTCVIEASLTCDATPHVWNGYIRVRTATGGTTIASIPFDLMQPGP
jgi:type II secretory pathway pseudopilin PulG